MTIFCCSLTWQKGHRSSQAASVGTLILIMRDLPLRSNHLWKDPSPNTIILGVRISTDEFWGDVNIQSLEQGFYKNQLETNSWCLWKCPLIIPPLHICLFYIPASLTSLIRLLWALLPFESLHMSHWPTQVHLITVYLSVSIYRIPRHPLFTLWIKLNCSLFSATVSLLMLTTQPYMFWYPFCLLMVLTHLPWLECVLSIFTLTFFQPVYSFRHLSTFYVTCPESSEMQE